MTDGQSWANRECINTRDEVELAKLILDCFPDDSTFRTENTPEDVVSMWRRISTGNELRRWHDMRALLDEMLKAFSTGDIDADVDAVKEELVKLDFLPDDIFDDIGGRCTDCGRRLPDDYQQALCPPCFRAQAFGDFTTQGD